MCRFSRWLIIAPAVFFALLPTQVDAADVLVNPSFAFDGGGWTGALTTGVGNSACDGGLPNIGTWTASRLSFSYALTSVSQQVIISRPSAVSFSWSSVNRSDQPNATATVTLTDADESLTTGTFITPITDTEGTLGTVTTTADDEMVTVTISGQDSQSWAGCYGTQFTVSALDVTPIAPPTTTVPETTTTATTTTVAETTTTATTTTVPETTTKSTTTTVAETTTTSATTTTTQPPPATTQAEITTTTETTTTTTTTTSTTTTEPATTTTSTTVYAPAITTTEPAPSTTTTTTTTVPETTTTTTEPVPSTTTTPPSVEQTITAAADVAAMSSIVVALTADQVITPAEITTLIESTLFADLPAEQIEQVFESLDVAALSGSEGAQIAAAMTDAPPAVKRAFEKVIDLFAGVFDDYTAIGSTIPVGTRRTLVAVGGLLISLPPATTRRRT